MAALEGAITGWPADEVGYAENQTLAIADWVVTLSAGRAKAARSNTCRLAGKLASAPQFHLTV